MAICLIAVICLGCTNNSKKGGGISKDSISNVSIEYAKGFNIYRLPNGVKKLTVRSQNESLNLQRSYTIGRKDNSYIKEDINKVLVQASPHWALMEVMRESNKIAGIPNLDHVFDDDLRQRLKASKVVEVGVAGNKNLETILDLDPDLILESATGSGLDNYDKWEELKLPIVLFQAHLERHPLGRVEWIKYLGTLLGQEDLAWDKFEKIRDNYLEVTHNLVKKEKKPKVFIGYIWKDNWYMPGGNSYMAKFVEDAGGNYVNKNNSEIGSVTVGYETAMELVAESDIWLNPGYGIFTREDLIKRTRFPEKNLDGLKIFNNNKRVNGAQRNDFWETGFVRPDIVLKDFHQIFYSKIKTDSSLFYYRLIE